MKIGLGLLDLQVKYRPRIEVERSRLNQLDGALAEILHDAKLRRQSECCKLCLDARAGQRGP